MHRTLLLLVASLAISAPKPSTMIRVEHYAALKDVLAAGDIVFAFCVRQGDGFPAEACSTRMAALDAIHDARIEKMLVLSSIDDLTANIARIPKDVRWIAYNMEPQMTPREEIADPAKAVAAFARICHERGLKLSWVPSGFRMFATDERLAPIAPAVDAILMQHQRELQNFGVDEFVKLTTERAALIRKVNPKCLVGVQVVIGRGSNEDLLKGLRGAGAAVDTEMIWTMQDTSAAREILRQVR